MLPQYCINHDDVSLLTTSTSVSKDLQEYAVQKRTASVGDVKQYMGTAEMV
jgi:hypothetical protein